MYFGKPRKKVATNSAVRFVRVWCRQRQTDNGYAIKGMAY